MKNEKDDSSGTTYKLGILIACCIICFILIILCVLSAKEACCILKVTKWNIFNYLEKTVKNIKKSDKTLSFSRKKPEKLSKIYPRSNSDTANRKETSTAFRKNNVEVTIIRTNTQKIEEILAISHKNLIPVQENPDFQQNLVDFSCESDKFEKFSQQMRSFGDLHKKTAGFSSKISRKPSEIEKNRVEVQYLQRIPADFLNNCVNNEKTLEVVLNNTKEVTGLNFVDTLLFSKKFLSPIARKNLFFKKHVVSLEKEKAAESV